MTTRAPSRTRRRKAPGGFRSAIVVTDDERRRLVEDCAFFRADRYRTAEPGQVRRQDLKDAAQVIDAVIRRPRRRGGR